MEEKLQRDRQPGNERHSRDGSGGGEVAGLPRIGWHSHDGISDQTFMENTRPKYVQGWGGAGTVESLTRVPAHTTKDV